MRRQSKSCAHAMRPLLGPSGTHNNVWPMSGALLQSSSLLRLAMPIAAPVRDDAWPVFDWSTTTATTPFSFFLGLGCSGLLARAVALGDLVVTLRLHQEMGGSALLGPCCSSATLWLYQAMGDGTLQALAALRRLCGFTWRWATEHFRLLLLFGDSVASPGDGRRGSSGSCCSLATLWLPS